MISFKISKSFRKPKSKKKKNKFGDEPNQIIHNENPHIKQFPDKKFTDPPTEKRYSE